MSVKLWAYPWRPEEDPGHVDPETGEQNRENPRYYAWFSTMRKKYGYPRDAHVKDWIPRFTDWESNQ